jgi:hypothetical protein
LTHDFLEALRFDELDAVFLVDLVDRNALVLQREEEVNELADLVCVVGLLFLDFLQLALTLLELDQQVKLLLGQHCGRCL